MTGTQTLGKNPESTRQIACTFNPTAFSLDGTQADSTYNGDNQDMRSTFDGEGDPTAYSNGMASATFTFDPDDLSTVIASPAFSAAHDPDKPKGKHPCPRTFGPTPMPASASR